MPEPAALDLAAPHRQRRRAEREAGHDVGAAGDRRQAQVVLHALVDVVEALGRQRAAGREHRAHAWRGSQSLRGTSAIFFCASMYLADVPKCVIRSASASCHRIRPRSMNGEPSYSSSVAPAASAGHEPVPHHPAAGREVEHAVAAASRRRAAGAPSGAAAACRPRRARCTSARRSCRTNTGCRADARTAARRSRSDPARNGASQTSHATAPRTADRSSGVPAVCCQVGHDDDALDRRQPRDDLAPPCRGSGSPCRCTSSRRP